MADTLPIPQHLDQTSLLSAILDELRAIRKATVRAQLPVLAVGLPQFAKMFGISTATAHRWNSSGILGVVGIKRNGRVLFLVEEIQAWAAAGMPDRRTWQELKKSR
jgi:hypothetical protein